MKKKLTGLMTVLGFALVLCSAAAPKANAGVVVGVQIGAPVYVAPRPYVYVGPGYVAPTYVGYVPAPVYARPYYVRPYYARPYVVRGPVYYRHWYPRRDYARRDYYRYRR